MSLELDLRSENKPIILYMHKLIQVLSIYIKTFTEDKVGYGVVGLTS